VESLEFPRDLSFLFYKDASQDANYIVDVLSVLDSDDFLAALKETSENPSVVWNDSGWLIDCLTLLTRSNSGRGVVSLRSSGTTCTRFINLLRTAVTRSSLDKDDTNYSKAITLAFQSIAYHLSSREGTPSIELDRAFSLLVSGLLAACQHSKEMLQLYFEYLDQNVQKLLMDQEKRECMNHDLQVSYFLEMRRLANRKSSEL
jgi:hypothetical protein